MKKKTVIIAHPHGFCAGVRHAIAIAEAALQRYGVPLYVLNELVHNIQIVADLTSRGVTFVRDVNSVPTGGTLLFSAHGVPPDTRRAATARGLRVIDATCPFVLKVHREVIDFARRGYDIALIGHRHHDEVIGVAGEAPDHVSVIENATEATHYQPRNPARVAVVMQTTLSAGEAAQTLATLRRRFPALVTPAASDICYATTNRQEAVRLLAQRVPAILVLGSPNSSNSRRLVEVADGAGVAAWLVSVSTEIPWKALAPLEMIGLTAGASTPQSFIDEVLASLAQHGFTETSDLTTAQEELTFTLPSALRR